MRRLTFLISAALLALALAVPALADNAAVMVAKDAKLGNMLVDSKGMTLYLYTKDEPNVSNCYDQCAVNWPPLLTDGAPTGPADLGGKLATTTRKDGKKQVTYEGKPLYYWIKDTKAGDTTGQGVGNVWYIVPPVAAASTGALPKAGDVSPFAIMVAALAFVGAGFGIRRLAAARMR